MTKLIRSPNKQGVAQAGTALLWSYPYDSTTMTAWRIDGEDADIRHFFVTLTLTGDKRDEVAADVSVTENGNSVVLAKRDSKVVNGGDSFFLRGKDLPRALEVKREDSTCDSVYTFTYADPHDAKDLNRFFQFNSSVEGYGRWARPPFTGKDQNHREPYCRKKPLSKRKAGDSNPTVYGTEIACEFPGW